MNTIQTSPLTAWLSVHFHTSCIMPAYDCSANNLLFLQTKLISSHCREKFTGINVKRIKQNTM